MAARWPVDATICLCVATLVGANKVEVSKATLAMEGGPIYAGFRASFHDAELEGLAGWRVPQPTVGRQSDRAIRAIPECIGSQWPPSSRERRRRITACAR